MTDLYFCSGKEKHSQIQCFYTVVEVTSKNLRSTAPIETLTVVIHSHVLREKDEKFMHSPRIMNKKLIQEIIF